MVARETIRQLLALARSTTFEPERATALERARVLFNKHRVADAHLRWELLTALGRHDEAGPEPVRPHAATTAAGARGAPTWDEMNTHAYWAAWTAARQTAWTEHERDHTTYTADTWDTRTDDEDLGRRGPRPRRSRRTQSARRRRKRVRVRRHFSWRHFAEIPAYTREIATRSVTFACQWCGRTVTQHRFPGPLPAYCSDTCKADAQREQTRQRVRRYRERQRAAGP